MGRLHSAWPACCLAALLLAGAAAAAAGVSIPLKVLVLTTPGFTGNDFLQDIMLGYGVGYDVVRVGAAGAPPLNLTSLLWDASTGAPNYAAYIMNPNMEAQGALAGADVETLWDFQRRAGARSLKFGAWPTNVGFDPNFDSCGADEVAMLFTASMPFGNSGINPAARLGSSGLYRCPGNLSAALPTCSMWANDFAATGMHPACNSTPILVFENTTGPGSPPNDIGGVLVAYGDGRESMAFTFDCAAWSTSCLVLGHIAVPWLLQGLVPGERRALLTVQLDDLLLATEFDPGFEAVTANGTIMTEYRATVPDLQAHMSWQAALKARLPAGSNIRLEFPFNGNGVFEAVADAIPNPTTTPLVVDDRSCIDFDEYKNLTCSCWFTGVAACPLTQPTFCRHCTKARGKGGSDWAKPLGSGTNRVPANAASTSKTWKQAEVIANDPLAALIIGNVGGAADAFGWIHHTFTHENLDNATRYDSDQQIGMNIDFAQKILGLNKRATYSSKCMVTPQISGLRNGDALAALAAKGINCAAGDNTWPFLMSTVNPHHMLYTTKAVNGFDGFAILPRFATEIYYNCSTPDQNMVLYNRLYSSYYGGDSTIDQLLQREATRVVRDGLLKLRKDPYMMHQANTAILDGSGKSLVMRWVDAVLAEFGRYASWPVASLKMDDLMATYLGRQGRDACRLSYAAELGANATIAAITVSSAAVANATGVPATCIAPLLLPGGTLTVTLAPGTSKRTVVTGLTWRMPAAA